eukprot:CAMPEP_0117067844 /NCGR_PEP_ID=MMETSP0472-20121206/47507_1 /TAXON_ID=693140 ORGANISM="Tiarina fusus, Strain LIS" /NCGR_SAMPLE_ID=MMETSP0472 /ASSEMBLY_ACC=CAM_ASM_000603 /LENGTH=199 /DNA_ID=CAMNT_0004789585 /DNA_START=72 /DNA_END=671 /DNA_ORIENTATION=-
MPHAHVAIAVEGVSATHGDAFPQMVMQMMLGNWDKRHFSGANSTSKMCSTLAEFQLAESMQTFNTQYSDTSLFGVYGVTEPQKATDMCWAALQSMASLAHDVTDEDCIIAHRNLKASFLGALDGSQHVCEDIGRQLQTYGRRLSVGELFARIDACDPAAIRRVANEIINDRDLAVAGRGSLCDLADYNFLRRRTYFLRY